MVIDGRIKVKTLKAQFKDEFGLTLRVYDGRSFADDDATLASIRKGDAKGGELTPRKNTKIGNLEDKILKMYGIKVQISGSDDSYLCDNDLTLQGAFEENSKKLERKQKKDAKQTTNNEPSDFMNDEKNDDFKKRVVLCIGDAELTMVEDDDLLLEELDELSEFRFSGTESLSEDEFTQWISARINVVFDGDLDEPELYKSITYIGSTGPSQAVDESGCLRLGGLELYFDVEFNQDEIDEEIVEDLFHLVVCVIKDENVSAEFREMSDYSVEFSSDNPEKLSTSKVVWINEE